MSFTILNRPSFGNRFCASSVVAASIISLACRYAFASSTSSSNPTGSRATSARISDGNRLGNASLRIASQSVNGHDAESSSSD